VNGKRSWTVLPKQTTKFDFKTVSFPRLIAGDDDFGEVEEGEGLGGKRKGQGLVWCLWGMKGNGDRGV